MQRLRDFIQGSIWPLLIMVVHMNAVSKAVEVAEGEKLSAETIAQHIAYN